MATFLGWPETAKEFVPTKEPSEMVKKLILNSVFSM